jgi:8-oxo-dGTP pyrophosphatase MutT (NUDIX family)
MPHIHELKDFTTSAFIMHPTKPELLFLLHRKLGKWLQPGGHVELDENPLQALYHELEEETGLCPDEYAIIEPFEGPRPSGNSIRLPLPLYLNEHPFNETHNHIDLCYLVRAKTDRLTDNPDGAAAIGWLDLEAIDKLYQEGQMFEDTWYLCHWIADRHF